MANQVTVYKGDAAFGSFTTINDALSAINAQAGDYKIALNGTFNEAVHLSDWDGVNITFVKAEGAEAAAITGQVIVGNATSPGHKVVQYAWNGNLRFEGITFDYTNATANTTRFEIRYIGTANTLDIVDCAFKGPGMINAGYNGGQPTNNNGDPNGDNGGNLFGTPWGAATDGVQGKLTVTGTTFTDGNINFWRNGADWSFTNCDFTDAPVTILGNPEVDSYDFINCDFSLTESKAGIASYLLGASDNSVGIKVELCLLTAFVKLVECHKRIVRKIRCVCVGIEHTAVRRSADACVVVIEHADTLLLHGKHHGESMRCSIGSAAVFDLVINVPLVEEVRHVFKAVFFKKATAISFLRHCAFNAVVGVP